jgi:hypothetical protein
LFVVAAVVLSSVFLISCETSRDHAKVLSMENLTDEEIDRLEQEISELPDDSVILKALNDCIL